MYMKKLLTNIYNKVEGLKISRAEKLGFEAVKHQVMIASKACRFEVENCVDYSNKLFKNMVESNGNTSVYVFKINLIHFI